MDLIREQIQLARDNRRLQADSEFAAGVAELEVTMAGMDTQLDLQVEALRMAGAGQIEAAGALYATAERESGRLANRLSAVYVQVNRAIQQVDEVGSSQIKTAIASTSEAFLDLGCGHYFKNAAILVYELGDPVDSLLPPDLFGFETELGGFSVSCGDFDKSKSLEDYNFLLSESRVRLLRELNEFNSTADSELGI